MKLLLDINGDHQVERTMLRMAGRVDDMSDGLEKVADHIRTTEVRQFASQGGYGSGGWAVLAPSTVARKGNSRILRDTGALEASLTGRGGSHLEIITPSSLTFGTTVPYAGYHQAGTSRMPQRRPVEPPEGDRREYVRILQRAIVEGDR